MTVLVGPVQMWQRSCLAGDDACASQQSRVTIHSDGDRRRSGLDRVGAMIQDREGKREMNVVWWWRKRKRDEKLRREAFQHHAGAPEVEREQGTKRRVNAYPASQRASEARESG